MRPRTPTLGEARSYVGLWAYRARDKMRRGVDQVVDEAERRVEVIRGKPRRLTYDGAKHWTRIVMDAEVDRLLGTLGPSRLRAVEVSGDSHARRQHWSSYRTLGYPEFDLCDPPVGFGQRFDVVICEQVLEHVPDPIRAVGTLRDLCKPGGHVLVSVPFLIRVHPYPGDYWRFTGDGLEVLLRHGGLEVVEVGSWGNAACVRANFRTWARHRPWRSLRNDPLLPVSVWALGRRPRGEVAVKRS